MLDLDFNQGAIWISDQETGKPFTSIDVIDNNQEIVEINKEISDMYTSYNEFDSHDSPCWFNEEKREAIDQGFDFKLKEIIKFYK